MITRAGCVAAIDVSAAQGTLDGDAIAAAGIAHAWAELGIGNDQPNPLRVAQVAALLGAGIGVDPYDFAFSLPADGIHAGRDPVSQAQAFVADAEAVGLGGRCCWLDLEWPKQQDFATWNVSASSVRDWALACLAELERLTGTKPGVYISPGFAEAIQAELAPELGQYPLWLADWANTPDVPLPWSDFAAWQYTDTGSVQGIVGAVDLDWLRAP